MQRNMRAPLHPLAFVGEDTWPLAESASTGLTVTFAALVVSIWSSAFSSVLCRSMSNLVGFPCIVWGWSCADNSSLPFSDGRVSGVSRTISSCWRAVSFKDAASAWTLTPAAGRRHATARITIVKVVAALLLAIVRSMRKVPGARLSASCDYYVRRAASRPAACTFCSLKTDEENRCKWEEMNRGLHELIAAWLRERLSGRNYIPAELLVRD